MKASFNRAFLKELSNIPSRTRLKIENLVFQEVSGYSSLTDIPTIKKLKGYKHYYRIRVGDYRIGIKIIDNEISFERVMHRSEIYKRFP